MSDDKSPTGLAYKGRVDTLPDVGSQPALDTRPRHPHAPTSPSPTIQEGVDRDSLAPEDRLLLQCSRVNLSQEMIGTASRLLQLDLNWDYVLEASIAHGVAPLFYSGLEHLGPVLEKVPARFVQEFAKLRRGNQTRNQRMYRVIEEIARDFERAGIEVMGLKDAQLCKEVYPDLGLRPIGDIDLLIHKEDYQIAAQTLGDLGFSPQPSPDIPFTLKYVWALHFRRAEDDVWVDLQWNVVQREWDICGEGNFDFEIERMWCGARQMALDDAHILVPSPEDMLFHLCLHLEGHYFSELILFCDIAELIKHYDSQLDWTYFVDITKKHKAQSSIYYVLLLVHHWLGVELPAHLLQDIEPVYFQGSLYRPLYENLTLLHFSLDEIRSAAWPPAETMTEFESVVRRQTHGVMQTFRETDAIATSFIKSGGSVVIVDGTASDKFFPENALTHLNDIYFYILKSDLDLFTSSLIGRGFKREIVPGSARFIKAWQVNSCDPVLAGQPTRMDVQVNIEQGVVQLLREEGRPGDSKKDAALKSIKAKLTGSKPDPLRFPVRLRVVPLSPEDLLTFTSARLGKHKAERLFGICSLLEFFRGYRGPIDWPLLTLECERYGVSQPVRDSLLLIDELLEKGRVPLDAPIILKNPDLPPRLLEWARYDPAVWGRYSGFKPSFFFLFTFLSIRSFAEKMRYLSRSLFGGHGVKAYLPDLFMESVKSLFSNVRAKPHSARDFAYWIEPEVDESV